MNTSSILTHRPSMSVRLKRVVLVAIAAASALVGTGVHTADAAIYAGGGNFGAYTANARITCRHQIFGQAQSVVMTVPPPTAYAFNARAGANNDSNWIRYRVFLVDDRTGRTIQSSNYSQWVLATDVKPATWAGSTTFRGDVTRGQRYTVDYRIEWWNSTRQVAWVADRSTNFFYINYANVGMGTWRSCFKYA